MGGCGPFPSQTERWRREEREAEEARIAREPQDAIDAKLPRAKKDAVDLMSTENLERFAPLLDRKRLTEQVQQLNEIAGKFQEIENTLGELSIDVAFNGGLMKVLPAIKRWQEGFVEEAERVQKLLEAPNKPSAKKGK